MNDWNYYYPYGGLMGESINSDAQPYKYNSTECKPPRVKNVHK